MRKFNRILHFISMSRFLLQLKGVIYRRLLVYKRSFVGILITFIICILLSIACVIVKAALTTSSPTEDDFIDFSKFNTNQMSIATVNEDVYSADNPMNNSIFASNLLEEAKKETGKNIELYTLRNYKNLSYWAYQNQLPLKHSFNCVLGFWVMDIDNEDLDPYYGKKLLSQESSCFTCESKECEALGCTYPYPCLSSCLTNNNSYLMNCPSRCKLSEISSFDYSQCIHSHDKHCKCLKCDTNECQRIGCETPLPCNEKCLNTRYGEIKDCPKRCTLDSPDLIEFCRHSSEDPRCACYNNENPEIKCGKVLPCDPSCLTKSYGSDDRCPSRCTLEEKSLNYLSCIKNPKQSHCRCLYCETESECASIGCYEPLPCQNDCVNNKCPKRCSSSKQKLLSSPGTKRIANIIATCESCEKQDCPLECKCYFDEYQSQMMGLFCEMNQCLDNCKNKVYNESNFRCPRRCTKDKIKGTYINVDTNGKFSAKINVNYFFNYSSSGWGRTSPEIPVLLNQIWKSLMKMIGKNEAEFHLTYTYLQNFNIDDVVVYMAPFCLSISLILICSVFVGEIIDELRTPRRIYMINCGLNKLAYWIGNFVVDFIVFEVMVIIIYIINIACGITMFEKYPGTSFYSLFIQGFSFILCSYRFAFFFTKKSIGVLVYLVVCIIMLIPSFFLTQDFVYFKVPFGNSTANMYLNGFFPPTCVLISSQMLGKNLKENLKKQSWFWNDDKALPLMIMPIIDIPLFVLLIFLIELFFSRGVRNIDQKMYLMHSGAFKNIKKSQNITEDAVNMEEQVKNAERGKYAVRIANCCKLFFDSNHQVLAAVNDVSLGIEQGSMFGFLGANGAGKTTLMKMIQHEIPISSGSIQINGVDVQHNFDPTLLSVCPQFNDHLTPELTGREQLKFYSMIFGMEKDEATEKIENLIRILDYEDHVDKPVKEMSGGNQRRCSVAISFLNESDIVLLDEPTASLDPVARRKVHDLINEYRGNKTFMLCTHLLDEAEAICDMISIMLKGCVYAVGTPQYLSKTFGKEWKVDVTLEDASQDCRSAVDDFFSSNLPNSRITIKRPLSRIYSIPAGDIKLTALFRLLQDAKEQQNGIKYFTCSSSTLEKVFLEIVQMSEHEHLDSEDSDKWEKYYQKKSCCYKFCCCCCLDHQRRDFLRNTL